MEEVDRLPAPDYFSSLSGCWAWFPFDSTSLKKESKDPKCGIEGKRQVPRATDKKEISLWLLAQESFSSSSALFSLLFLTSARALDTGAEERLSNLGLSTRKSPNKDWKFLRLNHDSRHWRVDRVLANHSPGSTASQGTSNIPFPWFLLSQCNRQARNPSMRDKRRVPGVQVR